MKADFKKFLNRALYASNRVVNSFPADTVGLNIGGGDWALRGFENLDARHTRTGRIDGERFFRSLMVN